MKEDGEVGETKILPFYFVLLSCLIWTAYAVVDIKADWAVFVLNAVGVLVMVYCIWCFAQLDQAIRLGASIFVPAEFLGVLVLSIVIFAKLDTVDDKKNWLGMIGSIAGTVMYLVSVITDTVSVSSFMLQFIQSGLMEWMSLVNFCVYIVLFAVSFDLRPGRCRTRCGSGLGWVLGFHR